MGKITKKNVKEICTEIDLIIEGKDIKNDYQYIYIHLNDVFTRIMSYTEIDLICKTTIKISKTKNRTLRYLENDFWDFINRIPTEIIVIQELYISENEILLSNTDYDSPGKRILSRVLGLAQEVLELKYDNSKGSDLRRAGSIKYVGEMINYYHIPVARSLFVNSITSKNKKEQYAALEGLENYYDVSEDEIDNDLVKTLNDIIQETDDRSVASTCLQIQINAGIIDEMTALFEMDDWKEEHYD